MNEPVITTRIAKPPNIHNLRRRAKALGFVITKATTDQDARDFGCHEYVLHDPNANWQRMQTNTLWGIRNRIAMYEDMISRD